LAQRIGAIQKRSDIMWKELLKAPTAQGNRTKRALELSVKDLINEFAEDKDSFDRRELEQHIRDNLVERVKSDGNLINMINENQIPRRTKSYLRTHLEKLMISKWTRYMQQIGFSWDRKSNTFTRNSISKAKLPAVKTQRYRLYETFIKKILRDEGGAAGMKNFIEAGNMINGFDERYLNYVISDALDHGDWLAEHEYGDFYLKE
jgi:hypothetical protein